MTAATDHLLRSLPAIRWQMLRAVRIAGLPGATEVMLLSALRGLFLHTDQRLIREQLDYLAERGLLEVHRPEIDPWWCKLTRGGYDVVDYQVECEAGIDRPRKYWRDNGEGR